MSLAGLLACHGMSPPNIGPTGISPPANSPPVMSPPPIVRQLSAVNASRSPFALVHVRCSRTLGPERGKAARVRRSVSADSTMEARGRSGAVRCWQLSAHTTALWDRSTTRPSVQQQNHEARLLTLDRRAAGAYRAVGGEVDLLAGAFDPNATRGAPALALRPRPKIAVIMTSPSRKAVDHDLQVMIDRIFRCRRRPRPRCSAPVAPS